MASEWNPNEFVVRDMKRPKFYEATADVIDVDIMKTPTLLNVKQDVTENSNSSEILLTQSPS